MFKVGVGLTFFAACELAKQDNIKVIFSGPKLWRDFCRLWRHKKVLDINKECLSGLLKYYERDLYRDDVITMYNNLELGCHHSIEFSRISLENSIEIKD